jgi:CheY-like chemotaxis protein
LHNGIRRYLGIGEGSDQIAGVPQRHDPANTKVSRRLHSQWCILRTVITTLQKMSSSNVSSNNERALVSVVDDDESVRESLPDLLRELGFAVNAFASAHEFLTSGEVGMTRCLVLDVAMPGMSGPELQRELTHQGHAIPIIFITARADESVRQQLMARGAVECLFKPFNEQQLRTALDAAMRPV